jgi:hypothetical protein
MKTFVTCNDYLGSKDSRPLENNTRLERRGPDFAVKLHATDVILIHSDGTFTLKTGGYYTVTTKDRINGHSPARLSQSKSVWYLRTSGGVNVPFVDGMKIDINGDPVGPIESLTESERESKRVSKEINGYIKKFKALIESKELADPGSGDCFGCRFKGAFDDASHLESHMAEGYLVSSLLFNAITERQYKDPGFIWGFVRRGDTFHAVNALRHYFKKRRHLLSADRIAKLREGMDK